MEYPATFLRGLSADDWVTDGIVSAAAFQVQFEEKYLRGGWCARSIGWEDDSSVVELLLQQKDKDGVAQFKAGVARFPLESIDRMIKGAAFRGILDYDREPLEGNPYHGNILISPKISKTQKRLLPAALASEFLDIIPQT